MPQRRFRPNGYCGRVRVASRHRLTEPLRSGGAIGCVDSKGLEVELVVAESHAGGTGSARLHGAVDGEAAKVALHLDRSHVVACCSDVTADVRTANPPARFDAECNRGEFDEHALHEALSGSAHSG